MQAPGSRASCRSRPARSEGAGGSRRILPLPFARFRSLPGEPGKPLDRLVRMEPDRPRLGARRLLLPLGQAGEKPALVPLGSPQPFADRRRPGPAQPMEGLRRSPCSLPFRPLGAEPAQQVRSRLQQESRRLGIALRRIQPERMRQPLGRRHREPRRMDEGEKLQQIEPRQLRIAEPLSDQRRIQHDQRRLRRPRDRLPAPQPLHTPVRQRHPDAAMGCVERGIRQRSGHFPHMMQQERKGNSCRWIQRFARPRMCPRPGPMRKRASC
jgi:hypothetical protein